MFYQGEHHLTHIELIQQINARQNLSIYRDREYRKLLVFIAIRVIIQFDRSWRTIKTCAVFLNFCHTYEWSQPI